MEKNRTDPICGMQGTIEAYGHYFCSEYCLKKYEKMHHLTGDLREEEKCPACVVKPKKWYQEKLFLVIFALILIQATHFILIHFGIAILQNLVFSFYDYAKRIWLAIITGLLIGGFIDHFIPQEYISKYLAEHKKRTIFYSAGLGFLMSACSHGILAIAIEIYKKGASIPAVIAFLLASPWANLPVTIMLFGFFGIKALIFVSFAIIIAIITGLIYQVLDKKGLIEKSKYSVSVDEDFSILRDIKKRWKEYKFTPPLSSEMVMARDVKNSALLMVNSKKGAGFTLENLQNDFLGVLNGSWNLAKMVLWWILIGMFLASLASAYVPKHFFIHYLGANLLGLIVTLILATIIEICSEGSSPLAFEIFKQTGAFGNSFVFLMAGVATDYTEIGLLWSNIGKKTALWLPIITVPQIIFLGYLFNLFL